LDALHGGRLSGAALDALEGLPLPADHPLYHMENLVLTPQLSRWTLENQIRTARSVAQDILDALHQHDYRNVINLPFSSRLPYRSAQPYLNLALKLGKLQGQLAEGRIQRVEVELLGEGLRDLVRPVAAVLLSAMLRPVDQRTPNWVSAPVIAHEQGIHMSQAKGLVHLQDYPNLIACRIHWRGENGSGQRTVAGVLFGSGQARLVQYDEFSVDASPEGYVLILENLDIPGVIGKVGVRLGQAGINIAQWRYGRERRGGRAVSFINLDDYVPKAILKELETEDEIYRARLVRL
jgi:D-3-phosphoglycerate dehydrogenase